MISEKQKQHLKRATAAAANDANETKGSNQERTEMKDIIEVPGRRCPVCDSLIEASRKVAEPKTETNNNMGVCAHCKSVLVMNPQDGSLREADLNDMMGLGAADQAMLEAILESMK